MANLDKYLHNKADKLALDQGCYIDEDAGNRVISFLEKYIVLSTTGKPLKLYDIQKQHLFELFAWKRPDTHTRRFTRSLFTSGKKSLGKTVLEAALSLYLTMADNVQSPLVVLAARNQKQAAEIFKEVKYYVQHNDFLDERLDGKWSTYRIEYPKRAGEIRAISCDSPACGGWNCSAILADENSHWRRPTALDPGLYEMLKGSMKARAEPLMICASNAGVDKTSVYYRDIYKPAKDVQTGDSTDTTIYPVIYEVPESVDWKDRSKLYMANPLLAAGLIKESAFDNEYTDAQRNKSGEIFWKRYCLNQWTLAEYSWVDIDIFDNCKGEFPDLSRYENFVGIDLSHTSAATSICAVYPINGKYYVKSWNFVPEQSFKRFPQNEMDYRNFAEDGWLTITPGNCIDYDVIHDCIRKIPGKNNCLVFDRWNSLATSQLLEKENYVVYNFPQYHSTYNEPMNMTHRLISDQNLVHDGNLFQQWNIKCTSQDFNEAGLCKPTKASEFQSIDFTCSLLMAMSQAMLHASKSEPSSYETSGVRFF